MRVLHLVATGNWVCRLYYERCVKIEPIGAMMKISFNVDIVVEADSAKDAYNLMALGVDGINGIDCWTSNTFRTTYDQWTDEMDCAKLLT